MREPNFGPAMSNEAIAKPEVATAAVRSGSVPFWRRLSTKLLVLTIGFVLISELLIFPTSVASFRIQWLEQRLATAAAVSIVLIQADPSNIPQSVQDDVLRATGVKAIAVRGTQNHSFTRAEFAERYRAAFGEALRAAS